MSATSVLKVKEKVQKYLSEKINRIELSGDAFTFRNGSSRVFISVNAHTEDATVINVAAPVLMNVQPTPELYKYIATHGTDFVFGHLSLVDTDNGTAMQFSHNILGDYLDAEELHWTVAAVAFTADDLDDKLQAQFGGHLFHED